MASLGAEDVAPLLLLLKVSNRCKYGPRPLVK